jgi:hypothetical protein
MKLKGSNIWVNEQFPPEIEEKRRKLYPALRKARKNKKRVKLVVDRLYIEGEPVWKQPFDKGYETNHSVYEPVISCYCKQGNYSDIRICKIIALKEIRFEHATSTF